MATKCDVYKMFGKVSEAAQNLEIELGTMLMTHRCRDAGLLEKPDQEKMDKIHKKINKKTLGQLLKHLRPIENFNEALDQLLSDANTERNRLTHYFHLQHNFRHNSDEGRVVMLHDLESIQEILEKALDEVWNHSGVDFQKFVDEHGDNPPSTGHLPL